MGPVAGAAAPCEAVASPQSPCAELRPGTRVLSKDEYTLTNLFTVSSILR